MTGKGRCRLLKGVNRQAIEINQPESEYFERAIFFVKPEYADMKETRLYKEAHSLTQGQRFCPSGRHYKRIRRWQAVLFGVLSAGFGSAVTAAAMTWLI